MLNFWSDPPAIIVEKTLTESSGRRRNPKSDDIRSSPDQVWFYYPYMWRNKSRGLNYAEFPWISLIIFKLISYLFSIMYILAVIARTQHLRKMVISPLFSWFVKKKIRQKTGRKFNLGKRGGEEGGERKSRFWPCNSPLLFFFTSTLIGASFSLFNLTVSHIIDHDQVKYARK